MSTVKQKYGFVYIWYDRKHKRYYIGCHWGSENDGYICSSPWMLQAHKNRPHDFKRRILKTNIISRKETYIEEQRWLDSIKLEEIKPLNQTPKYYNLNIRNNNVWHKYDEHIKSVGEKISLAKTGKSTGPRPLEVGQAISKAKKQKFAEKEAELGYKFSNDHKEKLAEGRKGKLHTSEWKEENSKRMQEQWDNGTRKRGRKPKQTMSKEEQAVVSSKSLKSKWADPVWAANQKIKLSEGAKNRPPRSEESKLKARNAQLGKSKPRKQLAMT